MINHEKRSQNKNNYQTFRTNCLSRSKIDLVKSSRCPTITNETLIIIHENFLKVMIGFGWLGQVCKLDLIRKYIICIIKSRRCHLCQQKMRTGKKISQVSLVSVENEDRQKISQVSLVPVENEDRQKIFLGVTCVIRK